MYDGPSLVTCGRCREHVDAAERACPHCGAPRYAPGSADARVLRTVAAAATFGMMSTVACAVYGAPPTLAETGRCDRNSTCADCLECATPPARVDDPIEADALRCEVVYEECFGSNDECSTPGESSCCQFEACRASCEDAQGANTVAFWQCVCGSSSRRECDVAAAPEGTCAFAHPDGARLTVGPKGWMTCVYDVCEASCGD
jgi:hypothetical protein